MDESARRKGCRGERGGEGRGEEGDRRRRVNAGGKGVTLSEWLARQ